MKLDLVPAKLPDLMPEVNEVQILESRIPLYWIGIYGQILEYIRQDKHFIELWEQCNFYEMERQFIIPYIITHKQITYAGE